MYCSNKIYRIRAYKIRHKQDIAVEMGKIAPEKLLARILQKSPSLNILLYYILILWAEGMLIRGVKAQLVIASHEKL